MCSLYKGSSQDDILFLAGCLYGKNVEESVSGIIYFCVYITSVPSRQTRHMMKNT